MRERKANRLKNYDYSKNGMYFITIVVKNREDILKKVKSSNGIIQLRASIQVVVSFFGKNYKTVISLTDRSDMKYPMLIGRKFLTNRFLVDVSKEYLSKVN